MESRNLLAKRFISGEDPWEDAAQYRIIFNFSFSIHPRRQRDGFENKTVSSSTASNVHLR